MNAALLSHQLRRHRVVLLLVPAGLALFQFLFTRIAPSPEETERFTAMLRFLPPNVLDAVGLPEGALVTTRGVLRFGYVHPFTILLLSLWTARVAAGGLAGEIGEGTMDLLASRPVSRAALVGATAVTMAAGLVLGIAAAWGGTAVGLATRDMGDVHAIEFVRVAAGLALLFAAWGGFALAVAAVHRRGGGAIAVIAAVMAVMFALDYIGKVYAPLKPLRPLSPFMHFDPQLALQQPVAMIVLAAIAAVGTGVALIAFRGRDM